MEKKWDTVIPADLKRLSVSGTYGICPAGHERVNGKRPGSDDPDVEEYTVVHGIHSFINVSKLSPLILGQLNPVPHIFNVHLNIIAPSTLRSQIVSSLQIKSCKQITRKCGNVFVSFVSLSLQWGGGTIRSVSIWQWPLSSTVLSQLFYRMITECRRSHFTLDVNKQTGRVSLCTRKNDNFSHYVTVTHNHLLHPLHINY
jgi:hypothetical protein